MTENRVGGVMNVLVIDDDQEILGYIVKILNSIKFDLFSLKVDGVSSSTQGLAILEKERKDIVLVDLKMPVIDGQGIISKIRNGESPNKETPFVVVSGFLPSFDICQEIEELEKVFFIDKPFNKAALERRVKLILGSSLSR